MKAVYVALFLLCLSTPLHAARSLIVEAEGSSCVSKGQITSKTEEQALSNAINKARSIAAEHVVLQAGLKNSVTEQEVVALYAQAPVRGLQELKRENYRDKFSHRCVRVLVKTEMVPEEKSDELLKKLTGDGPESPLSVKVWPERQIFRVGENINFFIKGNKPFFATIVYTDAAENIVQILPNPYHRDAFFEANRVYKLPTEGEYGIKVSPPAFGTERITVYAATTPLDELNEVVPTGIVADMSTNTPRGGGGGDKSLKSSTKRNYQKVVEFIEVTATLTTRGE